MWTLRKMEQMNLFTKKKQSHRCRKQTYSYQEGKEGGMNEGIKEREEREREKKS